VLQAAPEELGAVRFIPSLPEEKRSAIDSLDMGQVVKINLRFRERFWERLELPREEGRESLWELGFIHSPESTLPTWWTLLPLRTPFIVGWVGGPDAEKLLTHDENHILSIAIDSLAEILGVTTSHVREHLEAWYLHNWSRDPFARGAYSYVSVNGVEAQTTLAQGVEDTLFFAGEAMSLEGHVGTVHGAITTGLRTAQEILRIDRDH
jgi:monoamine oxidase